MPTDNSQTGAPPGDLPDFVYKSIAQQIRDGLCVLVLGPGAISAKQADQWRPLNELCANHLAKEYGFDLAPAEANSLVHVTSMLRNRNRDNLADTMIMGKVQKFYEDAERSAQLHPALDLLADLPFKIIINTTPDDFFVRYYANALAPYRFEFYHFRQPARDPLFDFKEDPPPLIYNLFGFYKKDPASLVLTNKDQLSYVNKITGAQHERLPESLLAAFNVPRFYLFLGFDYEDWTLKILLDELFKNARSNIKPFAYPLRGAVATNSLDRIFFQGEFSMEFPSVDIETFVTNLKKQLTAETETAIEASTVLANVLILHNEAQDDAGCQALLRYLKPLKVRCWTLADAVGQGDVTAWIRQKLDDCQIVLPLVSADFFDASNPALPLLDEIVQRNNPRGRFLVMPILLRFLGLDGTPLGTLKTTRPLKGQAVYGNGQEEKMLADIAETLKKYIETPV
ncbi:MAG: SIR2 family protein [Saprospiraceae bacterium]